jgi:antitoxin HigA-1
MPVASTSNNITKEGSIMVRVAKHYSGRCPTHPGALLQEDVIPATGRTMSRSHSFSASPASISTIFCASANRCLLPRRFGSAKLFGDGAGVWVRMQAAYDTWNAERQEDVGKIPTLRVKAA